jgi:hypothetical protein
MKNSLYSVTSQLRSMTCAMRATASVLRRHRMSGDIAPDGPTGGFFRDGQLSPWWVTARQAPNPRRARV